MSTSGTSYFKTRFKEDPRRGKLWIHLARHLQQYIPQEGAVLELGAGYCHFINRIQARRRVALDISPEMLASKTLEVEGVQANAIDYLRTVPPEQFDFIFASNFLEHLEWGELEALIPLVVRVLRPQGRLALVQPNFRLAPGRYFDDYTHRTIFTDVSLCDWLASSGLQVVKSIPRFLPLTVKSGLGYFGFLVPLYLKLPWRPFAGQMFVLAERRN